MSPLAMRLTLAATPCADKMRVHIGTGHFLALAFLGDDDDLDRLGALEKRHGVADRPRGGAAAVPAREHAFERYPRLWI